MQCYENKKFPRMKNLMNYYKQFRFRSSVSYGKM